MSKYRKNFSGLLREINVLVARRDKLDLQITNLKTLAVATYDLMDGKEKVAYSEALKELHKSDQSLTEEIRRVLILGVPVTPTEIRDHLVRSGYNFSRYQSNPLVSIHSTLNRLKDELDIVTREDGTKAYCLPIVPKNVRSARK
jgi:hypothetical protein